MRTNFVRSAIQEECICYANGLLVVQTTVPRCAQSRINAETRLYEFVVVEPCVQPQQQVMPDDHSKVVPLLPIPNRTVKRLSADDSAVLPCESRTSSGWLFRVKRPVIPGVFISEA